MLFQTINKSENVSLDCYILDPQAELSRVASRPAVIVCPGGGYGFLSGREGEIVALQMAAVGFHSFVLSYSTCPPSSSPLWPEPLLDAAWAVDAVRRNAGEWSVDPNAVVILGFSAGGHAAATLGVHWNRPEVLERYPAPRPDAMALCYPVITSGSLTHRGSIGNLTGGDPALIELAALDKHVGTHTPPAFIWHTVSDEVVPVENSLDFAKALRRSGVSFEMHLFPEGEHGLSLAVDETGAENTSNNAHVARWLGLCLEWIRLVLLRRNQTVTNT